MSKSHRLIFVLAVLGTIFVSDLALAGAGWSDSTPVLAVNQQGTTGVGANLVFVETDVNVNPSGCSYSKGFYFAVTDDRQKRLFAMLLAAQLSSRNVTIYTTGVCHNPWGYAQLDGVIVN